MNDGTFINGKEPMNFNEIKLKLKNYIIAYENAAGDGVLDVEHCDKAIDNRIRYLNLKFKDPKFEENDINIKAILNLEVKINDKDELIHKLMKEKNQAVKLLKNLKSKKV